MANRFLNSITVDGKIYYSNVFQALSDLPSATDYHGMFAHVHNEGAAYYAHAGNWVKLANYSDISGSANDSTLTVTAGTALSGGGTFTTNQSSDSAVTVNLDNTAVTPGTYGDANNTPQIIIDQQGRITSATTVTTAGSGGGGGGSSSLSIEKNVFTATANQTAFTISSSITSSSNTQVYIDGVYQAKSNYTTSGSVITFSSGVPLGAEVEVIHFIAVASKVYTDSFTGDGSDVTFDASKDITDENITQIYIDGVYQSKDNYTTSGTTITFSTAPPNSSAIEVVHFEAINYSSLASNQFTGTGSQTAFTLTQSVDVDTSFVFIQGVYQEKDQYSISGTTLTFTSAPPNGYSIEVVTVGAVANVSVSPVTSVNGLTGAVTVSGGTDWQSAIQTSNFTAVAGKGYFVNTTAGIITINLPAGVVGTEIVIQDYAGTFATNKVLLNPNGSENIQGSSTIQGEITTNNATATLVYQDTTKGWTSQDVILVPQQPVVTYLVVAGGGGAGYDDVGGGGAGGLRTSYGPSGGGGSAESTLTLLKATNYIVTVGAGGGGGQVSASSGSNSVFHTITSLGGGHADYTPASGGSGGGGDPNNPNPPGSGTNISNGDATNQGFDGGVGYPRSGGQTNEAGGGGGGAGAVGGAASANIGGNGGAGLAVGISGSTVTYAGGGGGGGINTGGTGGSGGGANGTGAANPSPGDPNTGGGGGGAGYNSASYTGSAGGSGIVILRYSNVFTISGLSGSTIVSGNDKVTTFTTGTGTIQFN